MDYFFVLYIFVVLFSLLYHGNFFFFFGLLYICATFFCYIGYIFFETYGHIVMVINSKLVISHDILKNIPAQN